MQLKNEHEEARKKAEVSSTNAVDIFRRQSITEVDFSAETSEDVCHVTDKILSNILTLK